jgi:hypothetical protein
LPSSSFVAVLVGIAVVMILYWFGVMGKDTTTTTVTGPGAFATTVAAIGTLGAVIVAVGIAITTERREDAIRHDAIRPIVGATVQYERESTDPDGVWHLGTIIVRLYLETGKIAMHLWAGVYSINVDLPPDVVEPIWLDTYAAGKSKLRPMDSPVMLSRSHGSFGDSQIWELHYYYQDELGWWWQRVCSLTISNHKVRMGDLTFPEHVNDPRPPENEGQ